MSSDHSPSLFEASHNGQACWQTSQKEVKADGLLVENFGAMRDSDARLVELPDTPQHVPEVAPLILREITDRTLVGLPGARLCAYSPCSPWIWAPWIGATFISARLRCRKAMLLLYQRSSRLHASPQGLVHSGS